MLHKRITFLVCVVLINTGLVFAQTGLSLEAEIQSIERVASRQGIPPAERHEALLRLARLRQLSGDIEGAAKNYLEAATAIPGRVDDDALLSCAYCLAAMGEWDRAITALEPLLTKMPRARFLDLSIKAIRSSDTTFLAAIVDHPNYHEIKPEILFVLWKVTRGSNSGGSNSGGITSDRWRQRLVAEFPHTLEGQLAAGVSSSVVVRPSPFWLFASGLDSLPLTGSITTGRPSQTASVAQATPVTQPSQPTQTTQPSQSTQTQPAQATQTTQATQSTQPTQTQSSTVRLQTGIFGRQANAQAQVTNLRQAGFSPSIERRIVNNNEMWAVTVPAGANQTQTMNALRAAGFDSFLVR